jgi:hypothetical protein
LTVIIEFDTYYRVKTELELYLIIVDYLLITIAYYNFNSNAHGHAFLAHGLLDYCSMEEIRRKHGT